MCRKVRRRIFQNECIRRRNVGPTNSTSF
ncbi:hypothetical protein B4U80_03070 [Leptotrombidium deliense]|uniref:Uncharacterized protein n=1 Tax=Leptotrombidium deliense TaxID=299467 RepID=A0A443SPZ6_9ACAR|nr:hypothetical protein B4U80_03070 [Leptotrombidium deliense]